MSNVWEEMVGHDNVAMQNDFMQDFLKEFRAMRLAIEKQNELMEKNTQAMIDNQKILAKVEMANANINKQNSTLLQNNNQIFSMVLGQDGQTKGVQANDRFNFYETMREQATHQSAQQKPDFNGMDNRNDDFGLDR